MVFFNDAACKAVGKPRTELMGKSDHDIFAKELADVYWARDDLVFSRGTVKDITERKRAVHTLKARLAFEKTLAACSRASPPRSTTPISGNFPIGKVSAGGSSGWAQAVSPTT